MASRSLSFELESPMGQSVARCRKALQGLGWEVSLAANGRLVGYEDQVRLRCMEGPIQLEVQVLERPRDRSEIVLEASMTGRGPIQSKRLRERIPGLERAIRREIG
jgi:hypothetical protein